MPILVRLDYPRTAQAQLQSKKAPLRLSSGTSHSCPCASRTLKALHITVQAIALDDRGVGDDVRLDVGFSHVFQKQRSLLHRIALRTGIQHGVVGDSVAGNIVISHFLSRSPLRHSKL